MREAALDPAGSGRARSVRAEPAARGGPPTSTSSIAAGGRTAIGVRYVSAASFAASAPLAGEHVLAAVGYGDASSALRSPSAGALVVDSGLAALGDEPIVEVWTTPRRVAFERRGDVDLATDGEALIGSVALECGPRDAIEPVTREAYARILAVVAATGYHGICRVWNSVPRIHELDGAEERYRLFCRARSEAFEGAYGVRFTRRLSASSAVGERTDRLVVWFLAARTAGTHWENPRQVSAYHYPRRYGPRSPTFARATTSPPSLGSLLFVSGTASIVGYESRHAGDVLLQLEETLRNLRVVIECATPFCDELRSPLDRLAAIKVYLRDASDEGMVRERLDRVFARELPCLVVRAEICRAELAIEIEGVCGAD